MICYSSKIRRNSNFSFIRLNIFSRIRAYDSSDVDKGTVFEIPVTVVQPVVLEPQSNWRYAFDEVVCKPNTILRHFILVPNNASWAGKFTIELLSTDFH